MLLERKKKLNMPNEYLRLQSCLLFRLRIVSWLRVKEEQPISIKLRIVFCSKIVQLQVNSKATVPKLILFFCNRLKLFEWICRQKIKTINFKRISANGLYK